MHKVKYIGDMKIAVVPEIGRFEQNKTVTITDQQFEHVMTNNFFVEITVDKPKPKPKRKYTRKVKVAKIEPETEEVKVSESKIE